MYEESIRINESLLGKNHILTANSYNNLAELYIVEERYSDAKEWLEKCLRVNEKVMGTEHSITATCYNNLAVACENLSEYESALVYFFKSYRISEDKVVYRNMEITYSEYNPEGDFEQWLEEKMKEYDDTYQD